MDNYYNDDKSQDFMEDVKSLCEQYGYSLITIQVKENGES